MVCSLTTIFMSFKFLNCVAISLKVQISLQNQRVPAGVGMASDPMVARRSGKKLPMEDISFCQCPLQGLEQVSNQIVLAKSWFFFFMLDCVAVWALWNF